MVTPLENTQTPLFTSPHPLSAPLAIAAPAQQEQLEQSRAQEAERRWYAEGNKRMVSPHGDIADRWRTKSRDNNYTARIHVVV